MAGRARLIRALGKESQFPNRFWHAALPKTERKMAPDAQSNRACEPVQASPVLEVDH
jgi:hypothetical protein